MFISKKHLSRRTVLRGLGAAVSLPLLDAMIPAGTALAQTAARRSRSSASSISRTAPSWIAGHRRRRAARSSCRRSWRRSRRSRADMTVVSGLRNQAAEGAGVHTVNPGTWLSCTSPFWPKTDDPLRGISADQIAAREIGADTPFPSLELCTEVKPGSGAGVQRRVRLRHGFDDLVPHGDAAAADGAQPAQAVLPLVRPGRHRRRARGDHRADRQPARPRQRRSVVAARPARSARIRRAWPSISTPCARSSAKRRRWRIRISRSSTCPMRRPACRRSSTSTSI